MSVIALRRARRVHVLASIVVVFTAIIAAVSGSTASAGTPGGGGQPGTTGGYASGGWGGCFFGTCDSGSNAGGGGGASSVQTCSAASAGCVTGYYTATEPRLVVAGGGGGGGGFDGCGGGSAGGGRQDSYGNCNGSSGGGGGNGVGGGGEDVACEPEGVGGAGATTTGPGAAGTGGGGEEGGSAGSGPVGGDGYVTTASSGGGGGGGGGYYGGGGGGATNNCSAYGAGGGAGSSYSVAAMTVGNDTTGTPSVTFTYGAASTIQAFSTGPERTFVVPAGVTTLHVVAVGGTGGNNGENDGFGGQGAVVTTDVAVTPGSTLYVDVASNGSNATVAPGAASTSFSAVAGSATFGGTATLTATLQSSGTAVPGETVSFTLDGSAVGSATTDAGGVATLTGVSIGSDEAGTSPAAVSASFTGAASYAGSSASGDLTVTQAAQTVTFTSTAPSSAAVGDSYTATATGGGSGVAVTFSGDAATTNSACTVTTAGEVTFDHVGSCVVDADQAGNTDYAAAPQAQQQVTVGPATQAISLTSTAPSSAAVGDSYSVTATGGASGETVTFSRDAATTNDACSVAAAGAVTLDHAGTCVIDANQPGNADYSTAPQAQQQVSVGPAAQAVNVTSVAPSSPVVGDSYPVTATGGASGETVTFSRGISTTNNACSVAATGVVTFDHAGTCVLDVDQAGNADYTAAPTAVQTIPVGAAATTTTLSVQRTAMSAVVTAVNATSTAPTGTVEFSVDGTSVGSAPVQNGRATLAYVVPPGETRHVAAVYAGDADFTGSAASTSRTDPTIHAVVTSARPKTPYGWYPTPVTVSFVCTPGSATLSAPCPAAVTLSANGSGQSVGRFVTTDDGGVAAASVTGINIDRTRPSLRVQGVRNGRVYRGPALSPTCAGADAQSGIVACRVRTATSSDGLVRYRATAVNAAGLSTTRRGTYRMLTMWIAKASYKHGHFRVRAGKRYAIYAAGNVQPRYEWAAPTTTTHPADRPRGGQTPFTSVGPGLWRIKVSITPAMLKRYRLWNLGVRMGSATTVLTTALHR